MQDRDRAPAGMAAQMGPSLPGRPLTQTRLSATSLRRSARRCPPARRESREAPGWGAYPRSVNSSGRASCQPAAHHPWAAVHELEELDTGIAFVSSFANVTVL